MQGCVNRVCSVLVHNNINYVVANSCDQGSDTLYTFPRHVDLSGPFPYHWDQMNALQILSLLVTLDTNQQQTPPSFESHSYQNQGCISLQSVYTPDRNDEQSVVSLDLVCTRHELISKNDVSVSIFIKACKHLTPKVLLTTFYLL